MARAAKESERKAAERRASERLQNLRTKQLQDTRSAIPEQQNDLRILQKNATRLKELSSHLNGFYEEINKLAKGKALLEVTPLMLGQANDIIRDSKGLIEGDTYLDRIKEFVPAGNNPLYPDVLVILRAIQQGVGRYGANLAQDEKRIKETLAVARTIVTALELHLGGVACPTKDQVQENIAVGPVADSCFYFDHGAFVGLFDFSRLDRADPGQRLSAAIEVQDGNDEEAEAHKDQDEEERDDEGDA